MKKKLLTIALLGLLTVGAAVPMVANAAETWDYGLDGLNSYNNYYHSGLRHYGSIGKNGVTYLGPIASAGYWSRLTVQYTGPYAITYDKHTTL